MIHINLHCRELHVKHKKSRVKVNIARTYPLEVFGNQMQETLGHLIDLRHTVFIERTTFLKIYFHTDLYKECSGGTDAKYFRR